MKIDNKLLDSITREAKLLDRLRMSRDLRTTPEVLSQRMLNAIEPGTVLPIHRHRNSTESCIVIRGKAVEIFYDDNGNETERIMMQPDSDCSGVNIEVGRWHRIESLESGTVIFEAKDGAYTPLSSEDVLNV